MGGGGGLSDRAPRNDDAFPTQHNVYGPDWFVGLPVNHEVPSSKLRW